MTEQQPWQWDEPTWRGHVERVRAGLPRGVTCSAGLAVWDGQETPAALQGRADAAMYRAKCAGRDRLVVD